MNGPKHRLSPPGVLGRSTAAIRLARMLRQFAIGTLSLAMGIGVIAGIALGLRSRMFDLMPLPIRVLFRAAGLVVAGILLPLVLLLAFAGYTGQPLMGDPCPPYC